MAEYESLYCPECAEAFDFPEPPPVDRRSFIRAAGGAAASLALAGGVLVADEKKTEAKKAKPAEDLVKELFSGLKEEQKKKVNLAWDHGTKEGKGGVKTGLPTRLGMYNAAIGGTRIESVYTKAQTELIERIVKAMSSGD